MVGEKSSLKKMGQRKKDVQNTSRLTQPKSEEEGGEKKALRKAKGRAAW